MINQHLISMIENFTVYCDLLISNCVTGDLKTKTDKQVFITSLLKLNITY